MIRRDMETDLKKIEQLASRNEEEIDAFCERLKEIGFSGRFRACSGSTSPFNG